VTSASCDCWYGLSAGYNYRVDLKQIMLAELVSTGHDYVYSLSVGNDFRSGFTAGNVFVMIIGMVYPQAKVALLGL
jgi:hypothetical protein